MSNAQLGCDGGEADVGGPDLVALHDRGGEKVRIDPPETSAKEASRTHEDDDFGVGYGLRSVHLGIGRQEFAATAHVTDEKLTEHHLVPDHLVEAEKAVELTRVGLAVTEESYPDRCVGQDHHATLRFRGNVSVVPSRRRGTSLAPGSLPRSVLRRW